MTGGRGEKSAPGGDVGLDPARPRPPRPALAPAAAPARLRLEVLGGGVCCSPRGTTPTIRRRNARVLPTTSTSCDLLLPGLRDRVCSPGQLYGANPAGRDDGLERGTGEKTSEETELTVFTAEKRGQRRRAEADPRQGLFDEWLQFLQWSRPDQRIFGMILRGSMIARHVETVAARRRPKAGVEQLSPTTALRAVRAASCHRGCIC